MMEHSTDRLFWTLTSIIVGALILTIGMKAFPKVSEGVFGQMSGVVKQADTANGHVNDAVNQALNNANSTKTEQTPSTNNKTNQTTPVTKSNQNTNNTSQNATNNTNTSTANPNLTSSNSQINTNNNTTGQSGISQQHQYPVSVPQSSVTNLNDLYNQSLNNNQNH